MEDRRRAVRFRAHAATSVGFASTGHSFTAPLIDFSPFGLSVKASHEVKTGTVFRLIVRMGADYFRAAAVSRTQIPDRFAVEFLSMTPTDREIMRRTYQRLQMASRNPQGG